MNTLTKTSGRILFSVPFLAFGIMHFLFGEGMKGIVPSFLPGGVVWVYITGAALVAAGVSIITKKEGKLAMLLLSVFLVITIVTVHIPALANQATMQMAMAGALKDIGLLGGALTYAAIFSNEEKKG